MNWIPYIQDALDLIEFANGATTQMGQSTCGTGAPGFLPFKNDGVGNENWGPQYLERLKLFTRRSNSKYPDFKIVNSSGTDPNGERFDY
jgi:alpha-L-arabinofuranosidase